MNPPHAIKEPAEDSVGATKTPHESGPPSRRAALGVAGLGALAAVAACAPPTTPTPSPTTTTKPPTTKPPVTVPPTTAPPTTVPGGTPEAAAVKRTIDKLTFGIRPGLAAKIGTTGVDAWIEQQLAPQSAGVANAESRVSGYATLTNSHRQNYDIKASDGWDQLIAELDYATFQRAVFSERQLYEVMCDFWSNHFSTWRKKSWTGFLKSRSHETVIRPHALGSFTDMLLASAHDTSMLDYLDNINSSGNAAGGVNENYARELLELHTLGIIDGQHVYGESDVRGVAKVISGWSVSWEDNPNRYNFRFLPWQHDRSAVNILGGAFSRTERSYGEGYNDGVAMLTMLANHPSTARYISFKLCRRFVSDTPSNELINSTAAAFSASGTQIAPTLRHIFSSEEFRSSSGRKVRRPFELVVGFLRCLDAEMTTDPMTQSTAKLIQQCERLGQPIFERHSPDGYPDVAPFWMSSEGLIQRWAAAASVARNRLTKASDPHPIVVDLSALLPSPSPSTVAALMATIAEAIIGISVTAGDVNSLCAAARLDPAAGASALSGDADRLAFTFGLLMSHPNFQIR